MVENISAEYPGAQIVICADDDWTSKDKNNPGLTKALLAALDAPNSSPRPLVAVPEFGLNRRDKDTDFNDLADAFYGDDGRDRVRINVGNAALPEAVLLRLTEAKPDNALKHNEFLAKLKERHPSEFEALRKTMKTRGVRVGVFDDAVEDAEDDDDTEQAARRQSDLLVAIGMEAYLFNSGKDGEAWADIQVNGHRETWPVESSGFSRWLRNECYSRHRSVAGNDALKAAVATLEAKAVCDGPIHAVNLRVARGDDGSIWLDLCDETWRAVRVDRSGWKVVEQPDVRFTRARGMQPLPVPIAGGDIGMLRKHLNVTQDANDDNFILAVAWVLGCLKPECPYAVLHVFGEQGSAKTTFLRLLRLLVDPNVAPYRQPPHSTRDLFIAAGNARVLVYDNFSSIDGTLSDTLASLATGGAHSVRKLFKDKDEVFFEGGRPIAINGINSVITRPDLAERALFLRLKSISKKARKTEATVLSEFEKDCPKILGVLLNAVARGLAMAGVTTVDSPPRMADFALWVAACEGALWPAGSFMAAYHRNQIEAVHDTLADDCVATAVWEFMENKDDWEGTQKTLLGELAEIVGETTAKRKDWPKNPRTLRERLERSAPFLREVGIIVAWTLTRTSRGRVTWSSDASSRHLPKHRHDRHHRHRPMISMV